MLPQIIDFRSSSMEKREFLVVHKRAPQMVGLVEDDHKFLFILKVHFPFEKLRTRRKNSGVDLLPEILGTQVMEIQNA